ncbi:MAG: DUF4331 domain-containing protein [Nitrospiraceae bacterium]
MKTLRRSGTLLIALITAVCLPALTVYGASHREAPLIALDPAADITDVYMFRSWVDPTKVVFIMNVIPGQEPSSGPNYFNFDDEVLYAFNFDLNGDGDAEDLIYEVRFKTETRGVVKDLKLPLSYVALPKITALDGPGSEGLGLRQRYAVKEMRGHHRTKLGTGSMFAVPSRVGPRTTGTETEYEALAVQGIYPLSNGGWVFAGQRDETFYIDLGAVFDTLNLRGSPILTTAADANDNANPFGNDAFSGFNINTIAIAVPISELTDNPNAVIGMYASTSRQKITRRTEPKGDRDDDDDDDDLTRGSGKFIQVARMANPLVNELIIGTVDKDRWNATDPKDEKQFLDYYLNSRLATAINIVFGTTFPTMNRTDLVNALLKYPSQSQTGTCTKNNRCSELLRLPFGVTPTQPDDQKRLTILAHNAAGMSTPDPAGWPNGRRPNDDVTDLALRVVAGALLGPVPSLGDGVNFNIGAPGTNITGNGIYEVFPFLPTPYDGRDRRHIDCGEAGANPCN